MNSLARLILVVLHRWKLLFWPQIRNPHEKWTSWFFWNMFFYGEKWVLEPMQKFWKIFEWALKSIFPHRKTCFKKTSRSIFHGDFESAVKTATFTYAKPLKGDLMIFEKKTYTWKKKHIRGLFFFAHLFSSISPSPDPTHNQTHNKPWTNHGLNPCQQ